MVASCRQYRSAAIIRCATRGNALLNGFWWTRTWTGRLRFPVFGPGLRVPAWLAFPPCTIIAMALLATAISWPVVPVG